MREKIHSKKYHFQAAHNLTAVHAQYIVHYMYVLQLVFEADSEADAGLNTHVQEVLLALGMLDFSVQSKTT